MKENTENPKQPLKEVSEQVAEFSRDAADRVTNIKERVTSKARQVGRSVQSGLRDMHMDEATIPDAFEDMPKPISPRIHAWLDFAVTTYFLGLGIWFAWRRKAGPATAALLNAGTVAGVSLLTDYDGDGKRPINFKLHGTLDAAQAAMAAAAPMLHGFADRPEARYFWGQAANELMVIASTDWDAGMPVGERRRAA